MLRLITGKAGTGKTAAINREIQEAVAAGHPGCLLIVPEQYSHEAERELCRLCGDRMSLYAEVLSFTGLSRKIAAELGGISVPYLDKGGKTICMAQALKNVSGQLKAFRLAAEKPELQATVLSAVDGMKTECLSPERFMEISGMCSAALGEKISELALIAQAYDAVLGNSHADPSDALSVLASRLKDSRILTENSTVYVDGFSDFTKAELGVLTAMLEKHVPLTVCLTLDGMESDNEIFALPRSSARTLLEIAKSFGEEVRISSVPEEEGTAEDALKIFAENLFTYTEKTYDAGGKISLLRADDAAAECEAAAAEAIRLVRETGCRWRDIAIAVRGFDAYAGVLESVFEDYGIPLFTSRRSPVSAKPLPALISGACAVIAGGWNADDVLSYLGTGLTGLSMEQCDLLSQYIFLWNLGESAWHSKGEWHQHPSGYGGKYDAEAEEQLAKINDLRRELARPLLTLEEESQKAQCASQHVRLLANFLSELSVAEHLEEKAAQLEEKGSPDAEEYRQLWDITVSALEQMNSILGDTPMGWEEFSRLFLMTLSRYDVGSIPATLDAVTAGDFDRMRRRHIKHLIIPGASDAALPAAEDAAGIFTDDELRELDALGAAFGGDPDAEIWREYLLIYNCISLPSDSLILCCPTVGADGGEARPSTVIKRAEALFGLKVQYQSSAASRSAALRPAFRLAASQEGLSGRSAQAYFESRFPGRLAQVRKAASCMRGKLSPRNAEALYGTRMKISASRAERFFSCRYAFFCEYGLKAKAYKNAEFSASEMGTFTHYVLQHTAEDIKKAGGFSAVEDDAVCAAAQKYIRAYEEEELGGFAEKSARFVYLFRRSAEDVLRVALDMAHELKNSEFVPLAFELDFAKGNLFPGIEVNQGKDTAGITGIADRIDGWEHDGKTYLRIVDYKTGTKKFSLSDIWYGMSMQMLLYLYALRCCPASAEKVLGLSKGTVPVPAGAEYVPAKSRYISMDVQPTEEEIARKRGEELKRSGIVLSEGDVPQAWETSAEKLYSPLKYNKKTGEPEGSGLATQEQFELLYGHIRKRLGEMAAQVRAGSIAADPYEKTSAETPCRFCDYAASCGFTDGENGEAKREMKTLSTDQVWEMIAKEAEQGE